MTAGYFGYKRCITLSMILPLLDFAAIIGVLAVLSFLYDKTWNTNYLHYGLLCATVFIFLANYCEMYDKNMRPPRQTEVVHICASFAISFLFSLLICFLVKTTHELSRIIISSWFVCTVFLLCGTHVLWHRFIHLLHVRGWLIGNGAVFGVTDRSKAFAQEINQAKSSGIRVCSLYDFHQEHTRSLFDSQETSSSAGELKIGSFEQMLQDIRDRKIQVVFIALSLTREESVRKVLDALSDTTVSYYLLPDAFTTELMHGRLTSFSGHPMIELFDNPMFGVNNFVKRLEDLVATFCLLPLIFPVILVTALLVKMTSRGPVFFIQKRYGINGEIIRVLKFRTMTVCEDGDKVVQATSGDARVTPLGRFLRRTSIDELPQFFNVLIGDMSVVGPRPHAVAHNELYRSLIKGYMLRHKVRPGITGWAQVNGLRGETRELDYMIRRVEHDKYYIDNWSPILDLEIMLRTVLVVLNIRKAY